MMVSVMDQLQAWMSPVIHSTWFGLASYGFLLNPIVLLPQLRRVMTARDLSGVSVPTFWGFAVLQVLTFFVAVEARNFPLFVSIIASLLITGAIIAVTIARRRRLRRA
jgi:uncharacterized protein with PQ loop repeat